MVKPTTWLPQLYQRFQPFWDRALPAAGLALLLWASAETTGAFSPEWRLFLAVALFLLGMTSPGSAYVAFVFLVAYPLYRISIYLAALLLAILVLTAPWAMQNLGATVLVLITPALLPWRLEIASPLLAGLWWGELGGVLVGALAALWLKLLAGMAGQPLDLTHLSGWTPEGANVVTRFGGFNSLQTLLELFNPFADTSQALLLHLLQILAWALAGYVAGLLARRVWSDRWRGWAPLLSALPAAGVLWLSYGLISQFMNPTQDDLSAWLNDLAPWLLAAALAAATLRQFYLYLRRPLARAPIARREPATAQAHPAPRRGRSSNAPQPEPKPSFNWSAVKRPPSATETDDDIIMLEID
ncbi:MAG: hypothetical protein PVF45_14875 [Anaerolineae bacterium]|jgi:hypothetical protein